MEERIKMRDYCAMHFMKELISKYNIKTPKDQVTIAKLSVELADELLKQLDEHES